MLYLFIATRKVLREFNNVCQKETVSVDNIFTHKNGEVEVYYIYCSLTVEFMHEIYIPSNFYLQLLAFSN